MYFVYTSIFNTRYARVVTRDALIILRVRSQVMYIFFDLCWDFVIGPNLGILSVYLGISDASGTAEVVVVESVMPANYNKFMMYVHSEVLGMEHKYVAEIR